MKVTTLSHYPPLNSQCPDLLEPTRLINPFSFNAAIIRSPCRKETESDSAISFAVIRLFIRISSNTRCSFIPTFIPTSTRGSKPSSSMDA